MRRLTTPWKVAFASLALSVLVFAMTMWVAPPGKLHGRAAGTQHELIEAHLGALDQRLYEMDASGASPDECEFTWTDTQRVGLRTHTFEANFHLAAFDPIRKDWVDTCDAAAEYYSLELTSTFTGALTPRVDSLVMHRYVPPKISENTLN